MNKLIALIFLALASCAPSAPTYAAPLEELPKIESQMLAPSVQLPSGCSGTIVRSSRDEKSGDVSTFVLTAKHCIANKPFERISIAVRNYDEENREVSNIEYKGKVLGASYKSDLAIIKLDDTDTLFDKVATVAPEGTESTLKFGEDVVAVGYPLGLSQTMTLGTFGRIEVIPAFSSISQSQEFYRSSPDIGPGNSGGGLFHKNAKGDYELIGTVTGGPRGMSWLGMFTPIKEINEYLKIALPTEIKPVK